MSLRALLPYGLHEWHGPDQVEQAFVGWFGRVDRVGQLGLMLGQAGQPLGVTCTFLEPGPEPCAKAVGRVVRGAADRRALTLDAFAAEVRALSEARR